MTPPTKISPVGDFNTWLARGHAFESDGLVAEALTAYEHAFAAARDDRSRGLAHMNRGNARQKRAALHGSTHDRAADLAAAVAAYDEAIDHFRRLPFEREPHIRNHLGAAWLNRGHTLLARSDFSTAVVSFEQAIAFLSALPLAASPHFAINLAGAHLNLAHVLLATEPIRALGEAQAALALLAGREREHPVFAEMSLRARRALVMAIGPDATPERIALSTDVIDDGLTLARHWESLEVTALRPLASRLFRLGAQLYRTHQPHFLAEFLLDQVGSGPFAADPEWRATADEALRLALADLQKPQLIIAGSAVSTRLLETARTLRLALQHLSPPDARPSDLERQLHLSRS